jgi:3-hydroxyacyl-CoA dehydrogenase/enoyl-CoA hydratase/3-hydroxybutyryl-CoA epimerase
MDQDVSLTVDENGVALITFDMPGRTMNVLNEESITAYSAAVEKVLADAQIRGAVVTSAKPSFIAGADLDWILSLAQSERPKEERALAIYRLVMRLQTLFRKTETGGKPLVAAVNGTALGGGLELALACSRLFVADDPSIQLGLPEAKVGLLPGGGGTQRFSRILGPLEALPLLSEGRTMPPAEALRLGLVDEVVPAAELVARARAFVLAASPADIVKPWDKKGYHPPGADPRTGDGSMRFSASNAIQRKRTYGNYPALDAIQKAVYDGLNVPLDAALRIEARQFALVMVSDAARNMVRTQFVNLQKANKLPARPKSVPPGKVRRLGVLGAGMMGAAIAHVAARAGIVVAVIDTDMAKAARAPDHARRQSEGDLAKRRMSEAQRDEILARVVPTTDFAALADADLVVEAVFENGDLKREVIRKAEAVMRKDAILATNTSTIPITSLAQASERPDRFVGIHFFSPVERMPLVEVIRGRQTGDEAIARALDFAKQLRKTPILVNDSRGFYTSRVFATYTSEGCRMLCEGIAPALIENAGRMAGMPVPPLALCDEIALNLITRVDAETAKDVGTSYPSSPAQALVARMVEREGRPGRKAGKGFYDYPSDGPKRLWPGLKTLAPPRPEQPDAQDLRARLLTIQALEAARCLNEGVVATPADADVAAVLGWGFAPWTGGPISYIDTIGVGAFVATCETLAAALGDRFDPGDGLRRMAAERATFYDTAPARAA